MAAGSSSEPNLVPFIDLFSVMICFLLMTAAWIQLESVSVQVEKVNKSDESVAEAEPPPNKEPEKKVALGVLMEGDRLVLKEGEAETIINVRGGQWDEQHLSKMLQYWKNKFPAKNDIVLSTAAEVQYGQMIKMYDFLVEVGWAEVGINPN